MGEQLLQLLISVAVAQGFAALVVAIGFYQVVKRHIDKEIPA